jgi:hypothetical protein
LYLLFKRVYLPRILGKVGEYKVSRTLRWLNRKDYKVYNDIYLKVKGNTSQIDHLVLSIYGIFVIETKNYKGWIFGNDKSKYWTQTLYNSKYKLYNPVIQNWSHVNSIKRISIDLQNAHYFPIVVFAGTARLKKIHSSIPVIYRRKLLRTIKRSREVYMTYEQLEIIDQEIRQSLVSGKKRKRAHIKSVKRNIKRKEKHVISNVCPKCGSRLELKDGRHGKFYGCSNFPNCKFTRSAR